jgi:hypothetical protein
MSNDLNPTTKSQFQLAEFKALRQEIDNRIQEVGKTLQYGVTGIAAIYAWLAKDTPETRWFALGLAGAAVVALFGALRTYFLENRILQLGFYLRNVERDLAGTGWETWRRSLAGRTPAIDQPRETQKLISVEWIAWCALILITIVITMVGLGLDP